MLLRKTVDRLLPLMPGETKLSPEAQNYAFRGMYMLNGDIIMAETKGNWDRKTSDNYPYNHTITREARNGVRSTTDPAVYSDPAFDAENQINTSGGLNRANRVERIARRFKASVLAGAVLVAGGLVTILALQDGGEGSPANTTEIESCESVIKVDEALMPIETKKIDAAKDLGLTVCQLGEFSYLVVDNGANQ